MSGKVRSHWTVATVVVALMVLSAKPALSDTQSPDDTYGCNCIERVGNVNCDYLDRVDIIDLVALIDHLFISFVQLPNRQEANIDGDPAGEVDVRDLTALINHLFITMAELPECPKPPNAPPETYISYPKGDYSSWEYINAVAPGLPASGVPAKWWAQDIVDFPYWSPTFELEWVVYGPYFTDTSGVNRWETIRNRYVKKVFLLTTGEVLPFNEGHTYIICDTTPVPIGIDSVKLEITCDTALVDTVQTTNAYGKIDTLFDVRDSAFMLSVDNRIAVRSWNGTDAWVTDTTVTFYDLFRSFSANTTRSAIFVLWVRARDPVDSLVIDPTPAFSEFRVIDPKFERDVAVIDFQKGFSINARNLDTARVYWQQAIDNWRPNAGYADSVDYWRVSQASGNVLPLEYLLSYKVTILVSDDSQRGILYVFLNRIYRAQEAGVGAWLMMRAPLVGSEVAEPTFSIIIPDGYSGHFGVDGLVYSGWDWWWRFPPLIGQQGFRIEDFIGATSTLPLLWPDLVIDTALLHSRYLWIALPWVDSLGALPEVDYLVPVSGAEVMYTYNSLYGSNHFLGNQYSFHGKPVAVRYETPLFRSAHWLFTPYAFNEAAIQPVIDSMLNWLMDSSFSASPATPHHEPERFRTAEGW